MIFSYQEVFYYIVSGLQKLTYLIECWVKEKLFPVTKFNNIVIFFKLVGVLASRSLHLSI